MIRAYYTAEPNFPASDQHPKAKRFHYDGHWIDADHELTAAEWSGYLLTEAKTEGVGEIARLAERRRAALTAAAPGKGQAYLLKYELVLRAGANSPDETAKTLLAQEATARGITYDQLTTLVAGKRFAWEKAAMAIETVEAASKAAVATAVDRAGVDGAVATARKLLAEIGG